MQGPSAPSLVLLFRYVLIQSLPSSYRASFRALGKDAAPLGVVHRGPQRTLKGSSADSRLPDYWFLFRGTFRYSCRMRSLGASLHSLRFLLASPFVPLLVMLNWSPLLWPSLFLSLFNRSSFPPFNTCMQVPPSHVPPCGLLGYCSRHFQVFAHPAALENGIGPYFRPLLSSRPFVILSWALTKVNPRLQWGKPIHSGPWEELCIVTDCNLRVITTVCVIAPSRHSLGVFVGAINSMFTCPS